MVEDEKEIQNFVDEVLRKEDDSAVPDNEYFKGFWVFALWGYIPPPGFEEFKCTMITTVVDDGSNKNNKSNGRAEAKAKQSERRLAEKALHNKDIPSGVGVGPDKYEQKNLELMNKGRIEQMRQKKFVLTRDKFELQMRYKSDEMNDLKDELEMIDGDDDDSKRN